MDSGRMAWFRAKFTVDLFLNDLSRDNSVRALNGEYQVYFSAPAPAAGIAGASKPPSD
jgi:hypothetical protein